MSDLSVAERKALALYGPDYSTHYRNCDEQESSSAYYKQLAKQLKDMADSFGRPIEVVDFGCGTGRYFHAMDAAKCLYGIDLSAHMLEQARAPVIPSAAGRLVLRQGGAWALDAFDSNSVEFVYSIGVIGNHCPLDVGLLNQVYRILKPGGMFFFLITDANNRALRRPTLKRQIMERVYPLLPSRAKRKLDERWLDCSLFPHEINAIIDLSKFEKVFIEDEPFQPDSWTSGKHLYCTVRK